MGLLRLFIRRDLAELHRAGVRVRVIGAREGLAADIAPLLDEAETLTAANTALNLVIAFNYGGRDEIVRAARKAAQAVLEGRMRPQDIGQESFAALLDTDGIPDPDLVIRTSGELRLSNFMLWQTAYSEFVFPSCYWPEFGAEHLAAAVAEYSARERRFGGLARRDLAL
jgi:undecaprenyl diphosphate synthase